MESLVPGDCAAPIHAVLSGPVDAMPYADQHPCRMLKVDPFKGIVPRTRRRRAPAITVNRPAVISLLI